MHNNLSYDLPRLKADWKWVKLGDVCEPPQYGYTTSASNTGDLKLLRTTDITDGFINWETVPYCKINPKDVEKYLLKDNDVLISRAGSVGYSLLISNPKRAVFASYLIRFRPKTNPKYFSFFLKSPQYWNQISEKKLGIAVPNVNATKLKEIHFPLPPLDEQKKIVEKIEELFSHLDSGVAALKKAKEQIRLYRQSVLASAFSGKLLREAGGKQKAVGKTEMLNASEPKTESKNNKLPDGWKWVKLGEVTHINPKLPFEVFDENILVSFLPMRQVEELTGKFDLSIEKKYSEVRKGFTSFTNGDVIFAKITPCMENGKIAVLNNLKNKIGFGSTEFHVLRVKDSLINNYLFYFLIQDSFRAKAQHNMTGAVGQKRVPKRFLEESKIPLPSLDQQLQIVEEIEKRFSEADNLEKAIDESLAKAESLRQSILKQAFEGKLV